MLKKPAIQNFDKELFKRSVLSNIKTLYRKTLEEATDQQIFQAVAYSVKDVIVDNWMATQKEYEKKDPKTVYYLSMEFLMGRALGNNLINMTVYKEVKEALDEMGLDLNVIEDQEPDPALGNGGLGRLAACFMDGLATQGYPAMGYSLRYEYGLFRQKLVDGWQTELPDEWLPGGEIWLERIPEHAVDVNFGGRVEEFWDYGYHHVLYKDYTTVKAVPYDIMISGYDGKGVSLLRVWSAQSSAIDMDAFNRGDYTKAFGQDSNAEAISKVLYPNDNHPAGKNLRLRQQYFLVAASISDIVRRHMELYGTLENFAEKNAIHINDTHPALAIPELMRILLDECGYDWDKAFDICQRTFAYTNHTVMSEALEKWNLDIFRSTLPRIYSIVEEMDRRCRIELNKAFPGDKGKIDYMALLGDNQVRMANICAYTANSINGVSRLHSEIIKQSVFHDYYLYKPQAFKNVTNGIAYRRWLLGANPGLCKLLDETIGTEYKHDASALSKLNAYEGDKTVLNKIMGTLGGLAAIYTLGTNDAKTLHNDKVLKIDGTSF